MDCGKPVHQVIGTLADEGGYIDRPWPVWPRYARVTIGTMEEMEVFTEKFVKDGDVAVGIDDY